MNINEFSKKLRNLEPGRKITYHSGMLSSDRGQCDVVNTIAGMALAVAELGCGTVFQRRVARNVFDYEVRVFKRLGLRQDGNGMFQEVQRLGRLYAKEALASGTVSEYGAC